MRKTILFGVLVLSCSSDGADSPGGDCFDCGVNIGGDGGSAGVATNGGTTTSEAGQGGASGSVVGGSGGVATTGGSNIGGLGGFGGQGGEECGTMDCYGPGLCAGHMECEAGKWKPCFCDNSDGSRCDYIATCSNQPGKCSAAVTLDCTTYQVGTYSCGDKQGFFVKDGPDYSCANTDQGFDCNEAVGQITAYEIANTCTLPSQMPCTEPDPEHGVWVRSGSNNTCELLCFSGYVVNGADCIASGAGGSGGSP